MFHKVTNSNKVLDKSLPNSSSPPFWGQLLHAQLLLAAIFYPGWPCLRSLLITDNGTKCRPQLLYWDLVSRPTSFLGKLKLGKWVVDVWAKVAMKSTQGQGHCGRIVPTQLSGKTFLVCIHHVKLQEPQRRNLQLWILSSLDIIWGKTWGRNLSWDY